MKKTNTLSTQKSSPNSPKAAIYIRVSTAEQAKEGFSLTAQEQTLTNYAQTLGYHIYRIYKDEGKSAKDIKHRPALNQLLKDAEDKKFQAIFVYKLDRFSRSLKDLILTIENLKEQGIDFISLQDKIETASASGKLMFHIISAFAEFERDIISERTRFGMTEKAKEGGVITKPPLGYKIKNNRLEPDNNQEKVKEIFNTFINTNISLTKLAKQHGMTTRGLTKLLKNMTYLGKIKFKGSYQGSHEPIISQDTFNKAQEKLKQISQQRQLTKNFNLLNKILVQGDSRFYDPFFMKIIAYFITKKAIVIEQKLIKEIKEPKEKDLKIKNLREPQKLAKYIAFMMLKDEGFSDNEIFFERTYNNERPDVSAKDIFVECFSCRANKIISYLSQDKKLWILTPGSYPWEKKPLTEQIKNYIFKQGPNWDSLYQEYKDKLNKALKEPINNLF